ncbi:hypothetical protein Acor_68760 [Acrocarpospora corrugata]|uniref:ABC transporter domain-containing protein n=1 Tax=Acrocarpospora corrugata TaxID=35763 RepID=A0A5M3WEN8_9ACTN|nr:ATP-binding cassette domain-containing protein [Acrocarpospora corrugata]GES04808.1 hypothetical protein Acor_68760 [Acrocarpospora corrugata]
MRHVSLLVRPGETLGLVGESGSGKTTTGMTALGLRRPTSGRVRFGGVPFDRRLLTGRLQAVLQHPQWSLNPRMRIAQSVSEPLDVLGRAGKRRRRIGCRACSQTSASTPAWPGVTRTNCPAGSGSASRSRGR